MATGGYDQSIKDGHEMFYDWRCSKCEEDDRLSEATAYCKNCNEGFCDSCLKSHNKFTKGHEVLGQEEKADWGEAAPIYDSGVACSEHPGQTISMYCGNHDEVCCPVCAVLHHGDVCRPKMSYVPDAAQGLASKSEFSEFKTKADQLLALIAQIEDEKSECQSAVNASREKCRSDLQHSEEMVAKRLEDLKTIAVSEINQVHDEEERKLVNDIDRCAEMTKRLNNIRQKLQASAAVNEASLFVTMKTGQKKLQVYREKCEELCKTQQKTYKFHTSPDLMQLASTTSFGTCVAVEEKRKDEAQDEDPTKILVSNIPSSVDDDFVALFFENTRKCGGGPVVDVELNEEDGVAIVEFAEPKSVQIVLDKLRKQAFVMSGSKVNVEVYVPEVKRDDAEGIFGVPKELCADMYVNAVADFSRRGNRYLQEFHFVDVDKEILGMVKDSSQRWKEDEKLIDQRRTVPEYLKRHPDNTSGYYYGGQGGGHRGRRDFKTDSDSYGASASSGSSSYRDFSNSTGQGRGHRGQKNFNTDSGNFSASSSGSSSHRDFSSSTVGSPGKNRKPFNSSYSVDSNISDGGRGWEKQEDTKPGVACRIEIQPNEKVGRPSVTADCFKVNGNIKVLIYRGAIDKVAGVDAVVCAADGNLKAGGMTAKALEKAGGNKYANDVREMQRKLNYDRLRNGEVAVSRGGDLKVRNVIHLVLPRVSAEKDLPLFKLAMDNVLLKADERSFTGIGMPLIGLGGIQDKLYLLDKFCEAFVETVCTFYERRPRSCLVNIHLVNLSDNVNASLNKAFINAHTRQPATCQ